MISPDAGRPKRSDMSPELRALLNRETAASEAAYERELRDGDDGAPLPSHVKVSRPGRAGAKVLEVLLNPEELDALEAIAAERDLPVRTIAREQLLKLIDEHAAPAKRRRTAEDYEAAANYYETHTPTATDIGPIELGPGNPNRHS